MPTETLKSYLEAGQISSETVQQAARFYLAEETEDLTVEEMRDQLIKASDNSSAVDRELERLERDPEALEAAALVALASAWARPDGIGRVKIMVDEADMALPVVETAILAVVAMYVSYLLVTRGIKSEETTVVRLPDGSLKQTRTRELFGPTGPLSAIAQLFGHSASPSSDA